MVSSKNLVWLDLEMTGLSAEYDVIIEIATVVTDANLAIMAEGPSMVIHQPEAALSRMDDWNRKQHGESGLTAAVQHSSISLEEAQQATLEFLKEFCLPNTAPLCGNTIYQDRLFLRRSMPLLDNFFHYRIIDVSSIKEVVRRWYPDTSAAYFSKSTPHRALPDVYASIEELKHYREYFFQKIMQD